MLHSSRLRRDFPFLIVRQSSIEGSLPPLPPANNASLQRAERRAGGCSSTGGEPKTHMIPRCHECQQRGHCAKSHPSSLHCVIVIQIRCPSAQSPWKHSISIPRSGPKFLCQYATNHVFFMVCALSGAILPHTSLSLDTPLTPAPETCWCRCGQPHNQCSWRLVLAMNGHHRIPPSTFCLVH